MRGCLDAITERKKFEMQWQIYLTTLAQPALTEEAASAKADSINQLLSLLSDDEELDEIPMDEEDTLALLRMSGRMPIRTGSANPSRSSNTS